MPLDQTQLEELKANIAVARKRELAFGLCLGKAAETTVLVCHKTKDPEAMGRQAKKDGETSKMAYGMMTVQGKDLNLSCQGDIPGGLARRTREMLKLAGLKLKVRILDPSGNPVEEDGDEEEEGEGEEGGVAAADPLAGDWAAAKARIAPEVAQARTLPGGGDLLGEWQAAVGKADEGDLRGALMAAEAVERRIADLRQAAGIADADRARWEASAAKLAPLVAEVSGYGTPQAAKLGVAWNFVLGKVNAPVPDYAAAVKAIATLVKLVQDARAAGQGQGAPVSAGGGSTTTPTTGTGTQPQTGGTTTTTTTPPPVPPRPTTQAPQPPQPQAPNPDAPPTVPGPNATDKDRFDYAEALFKTIDRKIAAYLAIIPGGGEPTPAVWTQAKGKIDGVLAPMRGGAINARKVADAVKGIEMLLAAIEGKAREKTAWKATLELVNLRLVPLDRHAEAASAPQIAPKIAAVRAEIAKAVTKANAQDFKGAASLVAPLAARCDVIEKLADDLAHYKSILAHRQGLVATNAGGGIANKVLEKAQKAMEKLLADAQKLATKEKYAEALKKLDQIPPVFDQFRRTDDQVDTYEWAVGELDQIFLDIDARPKEVRAPFQKQIDKWKKQYAAAKVEKTRDYGKSTSEVLYLIGILRTVPANPGAGTPEEKSFLDKELDARDDYTTILKSFQTQFEAFKKHKGRQGIEPFYLGMERDLAQAETEAKAGKYSTGAAILHRSEGQWPEQKDIADKCEAYLAKRDEVTKTIDGLKSNPAAAQVLAQARALMANAAKQALARQFDAAKATVEAAEQRAADAKAAAEAKADFDKAKDPAALTGIAADIDKAIGVYDTLRAKVAGKDPTGALAAELARADAEARKARDEKAKPAPDFTVAKAGLEAGIAILEATLPKAMAHGPFQTHLGEVKGLVTGLGPKNADDCIKGQIDKANLLVTEAETLAAAPGHDYAGAEAKLVAARAAAEKADADADLWPDIRDNREIVDDAKTDIEADGTAAAQMGPTLTRLNTALNGIDTKVAAEDFAAASRIAAQAATAAGSTADDLLTVQTIIARYATIYTARQPQVTGPDAARAQSQIDLMNTKHGQYQAALAAGNYDAALYLVFETGWAIDAAIRILGEHTTYEAARATAEGRLNALRAVRNPGVEDEVKALEKRYADGVALSNGEKHKPAETVMLALPAECDGLIAKAGDWKGYDDALLLAQTKLNALGTHAQAEAIRPMASALQGRLTAAIATASKGDLKGAKALLDALATEADQAVATADAAGSVMAKAGDLGGKAPDPALLQEATTLYDQLKLRPEAPSAKADLDEAMKLLAVAKTGGNPTAAATALEGAMEACTRAEVLMTQQKSVNDAVAAVRTLLSALQSHARKDYIAAEIATIDTGLKAVEADTAKNGPAAEGGRVRQMNERCAAARVLADKHDEYVKLREAPEGEPRLKVLEEHQHRYAIKPSIDAFRKKLDEAAKRSAAKDPDGAIKLMREAQTIANSAFVMAEMRANNPPSVDDVKKILNGPGGQTELDAMLDQLEPDAQRKVLRVAFEARFGCKLENFTDVDNAGNPTGPVADGNLDGPNIRRFYDIMAKLPPGHVVNNDSMRKFTNIENGGGSYYSGTDKDVVMREGDAVLSSAYGFGREHEVGGADKDCQPANDEEVSFFSWNTLHEVGHAVDDGLSYMDRNQGGAAYGSWQNHGRDTHTVAQAVARHFKFDEVYVGQFLAKNSAAAVPPPPDDTVSDEEWESRRVAFEDWASAAFVGNNPWTSNSGAAKLAIGGRVYQESYDFSWTSYALGARKQGMTGYQFRAPGEWFAELYAAYHSGKLKPTHPAAGWLAAL